MHQALYSFRNINSKNLHPDSRGMLSRLGINQNHVGPLQTPEQSWKKLSSQAGLCWPGWSLSPHWSLHPGEAPSKAHLLYPCDPAPRQTSLHSHGRPLVLFAAPSLWGSGALGIHSPSAGECFKRQQSSNFYWGGFSKQLFMKMQNIKLTKLSSQLEVGSLVFFQALSIFSVYQTFPHILRHWICPTAKCCLRKGTVFVLRKIWKESCYFCNLLSRTDLCLKHFFFSSCPNLNSSQHFLFRWQLFRTGIISHHTVPVVSGLILTEHSGQHCTAK